MSLGMLGAMAGAGQGISQAGQVMAQVSLDELKARRLAEYARAETDYKIAATEASTKRMAPFNLEQKEAELELAQKYGKPGEPWSMNDGTLYNKQTGESRPAAGGLLGGSGKMGEWAYKKYTEGAAEIALQVDKGELTPEEGAQRTEVLRSSFNIPKPGSADGDAGVQGPRTKQVGDRTFQQNESGKWDEVIGEDEASEDGKPFESQFAAPPRPGQAQAPATAPAMAPAKAPAPPQAAPAQPQARGLMGDNPFIDPAHMARLEEQRSRDDARVQGITDAAKALPGKAVEVAKDAKEAVTTKAAAQRVRAALKGGWKPSARDIKLAEGSLTEQEKQQLRELEIR